MRFGGNDAEVLARLAWTARRARAGAGARAARARRRAAEAAHRPRPRHGRRDASAQRRLHGPCSCARSRPRWRAARRDATACRRAGVHRRQRPVLPQHRDGDGQGHDRSGATASTNSTVVTAMCRNGTDFGIRVSGTGDRWFTAPVEMPEACTSPAIREADANPDMGDSAIVETIGLGGFAMAASPAVAGFVGAGSASSAAEYTRAMARDHGRRESGMDDPRAGFRGRADRHRHAAAWSKAASRRPSTPASRIASPASARSAPASCARRCLLRRKRWRRSPR